MIAHFKDLQVRGPPWGYFPELTNNILVVALQNVARAKYLFYSMGLTVVTGSHYLGGFIGEWVVEAMCLDENVQGLVELLRTLLGVVHKHPLTAYDYPQKSLHQGWAFVQ